jgi:hypothetical protein
VSVSKLGLLRQFVDEKAGVPRGPRKYNLKTVQNCFIGKDAVDWIMSHSAGNVSRADAIAIAKRWFAEGHFTHVGNEADFEDDYLFYTLSHRMDPTCTFVRQDAMERAECSMGKSAMLLSMKKRSRLFDSKKILKYTFLFLE